MTTDNSAPSSKLVDPENPKNSKQKTEQEASSSLTKVSESGGIQISNEEFINAIFPNLPKGASPAVCSKQGDPQIGGWPAKPSRSAIEELSSDLNNYFGCSSFFQAEDGSFNVKKENTAACQFFLLDDLDKNALSELSARFTLSWAIETSPGNFQAGIILGKPITDSAEAKRLHDAIIKAGFCDPGASGPASR